MDEYQKAAVTEVETMEAIETSDIVNQTEDVNFLQSTQTFKLKHFPDGLTNQFKAQFCVRGDQQIKRFDFFETYVSVVQWMTVCLMLITELLLELTSI